MALRNAQMEMVINMFILSFSREKNIEKRNELVIQFEDTFKGSIDNWEERIADGLKNFKLKEEFKSILSRKERHEFRDSCSLEPITKEDLEQISFLGFRNLDLLHWDEDDELFNSYSKFVDSGYSFAVKCENVVVGFVLAYKCPTYGGGYFIYVDTLVVDKGAQGKGIGRMLLDHIQKKAISERIFNVKLMTKKEMPAYQIYKHLGFHEVNEYVHMRKW